MSELITPTSVDQVRTLIASKIWYGFDPGTAVFSWDISVNNLATTLSLDPNAVKEQLTNAVTPEFLSQVRLNENSDTPIHSPLLGVLITYGVTPHIWTLGDLAWQQTKFERTGASGFVPGDHYHSFSVDKQSALKQIVDDVLVETPRLVIVDDKKENIQYISTLSHLYAERGITISHYQMKLSDPQADATSFFHWFMDISARTPNQPVGLILDFDGVVANTDMALYGPAADGLFALLSHK